MTQAPCTEEQMSTTCPVVIINAGMAVVMQRVSYLAGSSGSYRSPATIKG